MDPFNVERGTPLNWASGAVFHHSRPSHTRVIMVRKQEGEIKHPEKSHPKLSVEEAQKRALARQRARRELRKLEKATDPGISIKGEGAVQLSFSRGRE
jgi:hypothetical protein